MAIINDNINDISTLNFWRALSAEMLGTLLLVFLACGSAVNWSESSEMPPQRIVQISLTFGLSVATIVWAIAHVSGGHINPAVTIGFLVTRKITIVRGVLYMIAQSIGAIVGAAILYGVSPEDRRSALGANGLNEITPAQGFGVELIITFVLVFTVFATVDGQRHDLRGSGPLAIGLSVAICHLFAISYTGTGMNCARSLGPAVITGKWDDHWVYWVGPLVGGTLAALLYEFVYSAKSVSRYDKRRKVTDTEDSEMKTTEVAQA
ncbi:aquaporin-5-like [Liolophura sinensis]|uniref:aquaporin-5-like n=1 Tax=Liolophura sinensis TaxID=3198878 RepID=UPI0031586005